MKNINLTRCLHRATVLFACFGLIQCAHAAAPQIKTQAPGFYRMMVGDIEVTALSDGTAELPVHTLLTRTTPAKTQAMLKSDYLKSPLETSVNVFLVNTGEKLVMVDAGAATLFGPTLGKLLANLKASGYSPEQVDEIYITHFHADHVGGLMSADQRAFPNAVVRADKRESDYWLSDENLAKAPEGAKDFFLGARKSVKPYVEAGRFKAFDGNTDLVAGVKAIANYGHTPGHSIYAVESQGQKLLLLGDLIHVGAIQFPHPEITIQFDTDSKTAAQARRKVFADAATSGYWIAAAHLSFPGIGHLRPSGAGFRWIPVNYSAINVTK